MKKYLILLIIPLLFFSIGCNDDDDDNDDLIPVSEYQESILGHWKNDNLENIQIVKTKTIQIDPVYGTETSQESTSTNTFLEYWEVSSYFESVNVTTTVLDQYYTYRYDGWVDMVSILETEPKDPFINYDPQEMSDFYFIDDEGVLVTNNSVFPNGYIQDFTNSSFTLLTNTTIDTTEIVNNSYSIIETSEYSFFERIEESDIPTSN